MRIDFYMMTEGHKHIEILNLRIGLISWNRVLKIVTSFTYKNVFQLLTAAVQNYVVGNLNFSKRLPRHASKLITCLVLNYVVKKSEFLFNCL